MTEHTTINGLDVATRDWRNHRIPEHARQFCARLDRDHPAVERIDYSNQRVSVWMDDGHKREAFTIPSGWTVVMAGVFGGGVCIDLKREDDA